jgi:hypothetical protein
MSWQNRLREMVLAGGVLFAGCGGEKLAGTGGAGGNNGTGGTTGGIPCGNASPDPCCYTSASDQLQCQVEMACRAAGGTWIFDLSPHCEVDGAIFDATIIGDAGSDGDAAD